MANIIHEKQDPVYDYLFEYFILNNVNNIFVNHESFIVWIWIAFRCNNFTKIHHVYIIFNVILDHKHISYGIRRTHYYEDPMHPDNYHLKIYKNVEEKNQYKNDETKQTNYISLLSNGNKLL